MESAKFYYPFIVKEIYLDSFAHVNNAVYLSLFEEARWDFINKRGYGVKRIQQTGLGPVILELNLVFIKELQVRDEIVIETRMIDYEGKAGHLAQQMVRGDEICCQAEFTFGLFSLQERKLVLPTEEWLKAIGMIA